MIHKSQIEEIISKCVNYYDREPHGQGELFTKLRASNEIWNLFLLERSQIYSELDTISNTLKGSIKP